MHCRRQHLECKQYSLTATWRHDDFGRALFTVSPLPPDALYRLMAWFPALRQLSGTARARRRAAGW